MTSSLQHNPALNHLEVLVGDWEKSSDGIKWELDFDLTYTKVS